METENSRNGWKFWLGLAAGIAAGLYLNSEHGRKFREEANRQLNTYSKNFSEKTKGEVNKLTGKTSDAITNSKELADKTRKDLKERIDQLAQAAEEAIDKTEGAYEKAADWAVDKLKTDK